MPLLYHAYVYLEFLILACTIYILAPGYDISLTRGGEKTIVECKCYSIGHKVGRPNIQKLVGANNVVLADKMIFITTSDFSGVSISYAEEVEVKLINGNKLMELLHKQGFIEKVKINVMECQLETADLYPYVPRDIYESFFEIFLKIIKRNGAVTPGHLRIPETYEMARELADYIENLGIEEWK